MIPVQLRVCNQRYIVYNNLLFNVDPSYLHDKQSEGYAQEKIALQERAQREASFVRRLRSKNMKEPDADVKWQVPAVCYRLPAHHESRKPSYRRVRRCCSYGARPEDEQPQLAIVANGLRRDD